MLTPFRQAVYWTVWAPCFSCQLYPAPSAALTIKHLFQSEVSCPLLPFILKSPLKSPLPPFEKGGVRGILILLFFYFFNQLLYQINHVCISCLLFFN